MLKKKRADHGLVYALLANHQLLSGSRRDIHSNRQHDLMRCRPASLQENASDDPQECQGGGFSRRREKRPTYHKLQVGDGLQHLAG